MQSILPIILVSNIHKGAQHEETHIVREPRIHGAKSESTSKEVNGASPDKKPHRYLPGSGVNEEVYGYECYEREERAVTVWTGGAVSV